MLRASEWCAVQFSDVVIADNQAIVDHVRAYYARAAVLIAYGGDQGLNANPVPFPQDTRFASGEYFLAICRIEPENNIETILHAFSMVPHEDLLIVGNWDGSEYARRIKAKYERHENIELRGAIYDQGRLASLRVGAKAYVHGHSAGGTNPSLVEAMSFGLPVFAYDVDYNRYTTGDAACYWASSIDLAELVSKSGEQDLLLNASAMKTLAELNYKWDKIAEAYSAVIRPESMSK
jgi:glycosyltransferase involved in cell wall biosynthesis